MARWIWLAVTMTVALAPALACGGKSSRASGGEASGAGGAESSAGNAGAEGTTLDPANDGFGGLNGVGPISIGGDPSPAGGALGAAGAGFEGVVGHVCERDEDCDRPLTCLVAASDALGSGGPANGLCTMGCAPGGDACEAFDSGSTCVTFDVGRSYCLRRCAVGPEDDKCLGRRDVICDQMACALDLPESCDGDSCEVERCDPGAGEATVCLPHCNVDEDCPDGRYCSARRGFCTDEPARDKRVGETCTPGQDECAGWCDPERRTCSESCPVYVYPTCGSESMSRATAACFFVNDPMADELDAAECAQLCDCSANCTGGRRCLAFEDQLGTFEVLGRAGVCVDPPAESELTECP